MEFCAVLVRHNMYEEAWSLMSTLRQESIPLLINKALCLYEMDRNEECINACDRVLALLGTRKNTVPPASPDDMKALHGVQKNLSMHYTAMLIEAGADVNATDNGGKSAMAYATDGGFNEIVEQLLMAGAEN